MRRIGINFGDNDFFNTFRPLMGTFLKAYEYDPEGVEQLTKEQVVYILNELFFGFYMLFQNKFQYNIAEEEKLHTKEYLKLTEKDILFDVEVDDKLTKTNLNCNLSFYWVDFDCEQTFCC